MSEASEGTGLYCFLNAERECGPDCMAYSANAVGSDYTTPDGQVRQWAHCMPLVQLHRLAKHTVIATNIYQSVSARGPNPEQPR